MDGAIAADGHVVDRAAEARRQQGGPGLGRLDPGLSPRALAIGRRPDGSLRAQLLDPEAFRPGPSRFLRARPAGSAFVARCLHEVEERVQRIVQSANS